ncbi:MAG: methyltransferase domain-containing protein [Flavobacteriaceae bacterium]
MNCPLCHSPLKTLIDTDYFDCSGCRALVKNPSLLPTPEEEQKRYESHNNDVNDPRYQKFTAPIWQYILEHFNREDLGLDFGSGTGPVISKMLLDKGYTIKQYDPFFSPDYALLDLNYHYIACCEVVEHFFHPRDEFTKLDRMLLPGGTFVGMTLLYNDGIDFKTWSYRKDETHVFIYRKETLEYIARLFDYKLTELTNRFFVFEK